MNCLDESNPLTHPPTKGDPMASVKGWTSLLRGYFATTILPTLAPRIGDGYGDPRKDPPPLADIRATLRQMLIDGYGEPLEATAEEALATYVPSWDTGTDDGHVWMHKWGADGLFVSVMSEPLP